MAEGLEKLYYKTSPEEFADLLNSLRKHPDTLSVFAWTKQPNFYYPDRDTAAEILKLNEAVWRFDYMFAQFSSFGQRQIIQSLVIEEILSTNAIEQIHSTRHDVFSVLKQAGKTSDRRLISLVNGYRLLLNGPQDVDSHADIRKVYDNVLNSAVQKEDLPDGQYYRQNRVSVTDGIRTVHEGFYPEEEVRRGMEEFLAVYHDPKLDICERLILSHIILETVHPFYDGNGRLGRFLFTAGMYRSTGSCAAFLISAAMNHQKSAYYKALREADRIHQYGSLNASVSMICRILRNEIFAAADHLEHIKKMSGMTEASGNTYTGTEHRILGVLQEGTLLSDYGISNQEIIDALNISRRTVISAMNRFRNEGLLSDTKLGKTVFHKLKPADDPAA